jgi:hypothetical protein
MARTQIIESYIVLAEQYIWEAKNRQDDDRPLLVEEGALALQGAYREYLNVLTVGGEGVRQSGELDHLRSRLGDLALQLNQVYATMVTYKRAEDELTE